MTADQLLNALFNAGIAISVGATVLSLGMTYTIAQLLAPLGRVGLVILMIVLNAVAIPAIAWGVAEAFPIADAYVAGLVLATLGAGSAGGLKAAQLSKKADLPLAVSLVVVLQLLNIVAVPLWAGRVVSGASISALDILKSLLALVLIPLVVGLVVRARYAEHAQDWMAGLVKVANLALVIALAAGIAVNWETIVGMFGSWVLLASLVIIALCLVLGALVGGREAPTRTTTGLVSGLRFGSLGLIIIGTQLNGSPEYLGPAITFALLDFVLPLVLAIEVGRKAQPATKTATTS
jgi:BASS family bile acid:Na+ symporter